MTLRSVLGAPTSPFQAPSLLWQALTTPVHLFLSYIHVFLVYLRDNNRIAPRNAIRVVCVSDTHTYKPSLPPGDVLIHAGDMTNSGSVSDIQTQFDWLSEQPYQHVIAIAGNHDSFFDPKSRHSEDKGNAIDFKKVRYLQHSSTTLDFPSKDGRKLVLFGAPQIPACGGDEMAFQYQRSDDAWTGTIPADVDVLVTHTPPRWHLDLPCGMGCDFLLTEVWKVKPQLHVFGHVHAGRGKQLVFWDEAQGAAERLMARQKVWNLISISFWLDVVRMVLYDLIGIIWTRIWGAEAQKTIMVNSGVVDFQGKLRFSGQAIDI